VSVFAAVVQAAIWMRAPRRTNVRSAVVDVSASAESAARRVVALERIEAIAFPSGRRTSEEAALASRGVVSNAARPS
jgi:hypothetical protein